MSEDRVGGRPSDRAFIKAGGLLYRELERLAREDAEKARKKEEK